MDVLREAQQCGALGQIGRIGETGECKLWGRFPRQPLLQAPGREFNPPRYCGK
ncbi:MAG: hypothetical protein ACR2H5_04465 [Ktedonobacteraceae bacterium]